MSVRDLAEQTEGRPLRAVADLLGEGVAGREFAAVQLESVMKGEAVRDGWVSWLARDLLVRHIRAHCPGGWSGPETSEFMRITTAVFWTGALDPLIGGEAAERASSRLLAEAPAGWEPFGSDDPLIASIVAEALGPEAS